MTEAQTNLELAATPSDFAALREVEVAWLVCQLSDSIANLGYPVGVGMAPHPDQVKKAATALFERYAKMIEAAHATAAALRSAAIPASVGTDMRSALVARLIENERRKAVERAAPQQDVPAVPITDEMVNAVGMAIDNFEMADGDPFGALLFDSDYVDADTTHDRIVRKNEICESLARACLTAALATAAPPTLKQSLERFTDAANKVHGLAERTRTVLAAQPGHALDAGRDDLREQYARTILKSREFSDARIEFFKTNELGVWIEACKAADAILSLHPKPASSREGSASV